LRPLRGRVRRAGAENFLPLLYYSYRKNVKFSPNGDAQQRVSTEILFLGEFQRIFATQRERV
jgi:hypothetical protein